MNCKRCNGTGTIPTPAVIAWGYYEPAGEDVCPDCDIDEVPL